MWGVNIILNFDMLSSGEDKKRYELIILIKQAILF